MKYIVYVDKSFYNLKKICAWYSYLAYFFCENKFIKKK